MDDDKYPPESGRRRFVKGVVGSSSLAAMGTGTMGALNIATNTGPSTGGPTDYVGIENTDGPAPRGMPIVPLTVDSEGHLKGVWPETRNKEFSDGSTATVTAEEMGNVTYSGRWFQYCGIQTAAGLEPEADQDNFLRSSPGLFDWQADIEPGTKLTLEHLDDYEEWQGPVGSAGAGKAAQATWRSEAGEGEEVKQLPVQVLRSPAVSDLPDGHEHGAFLEAATEADCIAWLDKCTHFCCTPGFNSFPDAPKFGAADAVYCQCHQSVYDPLSPVALSFNAFPRPD
jgi:Rieske Fe-S protein